MKVEQVYNVVNQATKEILGETAALEKDLSNIVDVGKAIINSNEVENYTRKLIDHIGKVVFVNRVYKGSAPSVLMDSWEYGAILEKVRAALPEAVINEDWELTDGGSYDPNVFNSPKIEAKFFNKKITFEIDKSITEKQVKSSFSNAVQLNAFISMIFNSIDKSMTIKLDSLIMDTINNMIADTIHDEYSSGSVTASSGVKAVNLLYLYNEQAGGTPLTTDQAMLNPEFLRFAALTMSNYIVRLGSISTLFNIGGTEKFTPREDLHVVLLSDFRKAAMYNMQSVTFHDELADLPFDETVPFWQGSGEDYSFDSVSTINIKSANGNTVNQSGILGVMFDREALGVTNIDHRVRTHYNEKAEFYNYFYKYDAGYFNDDNENFVVFFVA